MSWKSSPLSVATPLTSGSLRAEVWGRVNAASGRGLLLYGNSCTENVTVYAELSDALGFQSSVAGLRGALRVRAQQILSAPGCQRNSPAHASAAALARQKLSCLAFRVRGQGGASHHLPTKAQVTQLGSAPPPIFLPSPHNSPHPTAVPAEKTQVFSLFVSTLFFFPQCPPLSPHPLSFHVHGLVSSSLFEIASSPILTHSFVSFESR